ncbi:MAG: LPS assembly lipoprotein LptE [Pseudomonadota bacterium]
MKFNTVLDYASKALLPVMAALILSACGFHLRGSGDQFNLPFKTIYLGFPEASLLGIELKRNIRASDATFVLSDPKTAAANVELLSEAKDKQILSLNSEGRVREYSLVYSIRFRVRDSEGNELLAPTDITLKRSINFNESQVLAKEGEEAMLYRDMQSDLVQQILRRLAAIKPVQ